MQSIDLRVGRDYVLRRYKDSSECRVRVLELGVEKEFTAYRSYRFGPRRHQNAVRVQSVSDDGVLGGYIETVLPRALIEPWEDYAARRDACRADVAKLEAIRAERRAAVAPAAELISAMTDCRIDLDDNGGAYLSAEAIAKIAGTLEGLGRAAA